MLDEMVNWNMKDGEDGWEGLGGEKESERQEERTHEGINESEC